MGLDLVELVMEVEQKFDIEIPDEAASEIRTVGDLTDWVCIATSAEQPGSDWTQPLIEQAVFKLVADQLGARIGDLRPSTRFVEDIGAG